MFKSKNFCHIASNNRNQVKVGVFVYRTTDDLATVSTSGYFNERIIDINLHDIIIHEKIDAVDATKVERNTLCVIERTLDNVGTTVVESKWEEDIEQYIENTFVKKDGSSIMTGPLKMQRTTTSPVFQMQPNADDTGLEFKEANHPSDTISMDLLNSNLTTQHLNNINVPSLSVGTTDSVALKSQVDLAANSGSQLYTTGVWYAQMYSGSTIPSGAEYNGRNYADFSQTDSGGNPIIVIYEGQNGSWVEIDRITPPDSYNGYITVTSKIWDIPEQLDQQGGQILWSYNQKTFTPYPRIVNLGSDIARTDLSNLTDTGKNISTWSSNVTNCIVEIPQDIKLEISSNNLILKAGSVVYAPNGVDGGVNQFVSYTINSDLTASITWGVDGTTYLYYDVLTSTLFVEHPDYNKGSGTTGVTDGTYFYTNTNYIVRTTSGQQTRTLSFPLAKITITSSNTISSIDQIFNGFGYIGSTVFVLPGVKGLVPNGRNEDGSLKTVQYSISQVLIRTEVGTSIYNYELAINTNGYINYSSKYTLGDDGFLHVPNGNIYFDFTFARYSADIDGNITSFDTKSVFHAFDYNDISTVLDAIWPIGSTYLGTRTSCPLAALIPGSIWTLVSGGYALWTGNGTAGSGTTANANYANAPANTTIAAGAPNISGTFKANAATMYETPKGHITETTGAFSGTAGTNSQIDGGDGGTDTYGTISFNASSSNSIYGNSTTVQPPAYVVNVWVRVA